MPTSAAEQWGGGRRGTGGQAGTRGAGSPVCRGLSPRGAQAPERGDTGQDFPERQVRERQAKGKEEDEEGGGLGKRKEGERGVKKEAIARSALGRASSS